MCQMFVLMQKKAAKIAIHIAQANAFQNVNFKQKGKKL